jgi:hypothetical protein
MITLTTALKSLQIIEDKLVEKDSEMKSAIFFESVYKRVCDRVDDDGRKTMLYLNRWFNTKGMEGLKLIQDSKRVNYYTINGGQFITHVNSSIRRVECVFFRRHIDTNLLNFTDRCNIIYTYLSKTCGVKQSLELNKKGNDLFDQIIKHFSTDEIMNEIFNKSSDEHVEREILLSNIIFQARENGLDAVKRVIKETENG